MQMHRLIILCFLFSFTGAAADPDHISINCGAAAPATALSGRQWLRDAAPQGSSTTSTVKGDLISAVHPVPYKTARLSRSKFSYSFHLSPGQKFIRLHFNPASYNGFQSLSDLFTVEAGPVTLLANFSASITARALAVNTFIKEFCVILQENQPLNIVFSPETSFHSKYNYAFINGIEIISVPSTISYCHGGDSGVRVLGQNYVIHVENTTALEMVHRQDIKWGSLSSDNDIDGMFGMWANKAYNRSWRVSVDVGFRYLVRLHLCEVGLKMDFMLLINNRTALTSADMLKQRRNQTNRWYNNYMVMVEGHKREGKRIISISLHSRHEFLDRHGPLEGFEVFKLSNPDLSLASPNPLPPRGDSPSQTMQTLLHSLLGRKNAVATVVFTMLCLVKIIARLLHRMRGSKEENMPSARARGLCRYFSLAEIRSATQNFHVEFILGKGGFGKVYKGLLDNGRDVVAIKRSKPDSNQGEQQFWTEVEMLSQLRHVNLVSLIGYCMEQQEMILVYEYMPRGTLADHLYKLSRKSNPFYPLSWKQRLKICIGAGRALDYLHTGLGIIHRDVKASNILLDEKFVAKVSDFGLAKTGSSSESQSQDSTNFKGTIGYIDPNYFRTRKITKKSDTYSFGVVLLEVLCGRPAVEPWYEEDKHGLTTWAMDNISKGQVDRIVAPSLGGKISIDSLKTFVKVAERCLHDEPKKRPAMTHIVIELELALQQQEKAESLPPKERTSVEKLNVADNVSPSPSGQILLQPNLRIFTFSELKAATRNFRSDTVLGVGGFGTVYKGLLHNKFYSKAGSGTLIAVKRLNSESTQGFQEWQSEVNILGRLSHPNLVRLLGYGLEDKELLLVYEFMPKGSLENHLFGRGVSAQPLPWDIRLKILIGAAHGLAFLHASHRKVIYRDFKTSNILLDGSYQAKLSDFGLAKMGPTYSRSHVTTQVMGTNGYAAPEYLATGHLYVKSDVYGFGVVLVEMLTGLRALDTNRPSGQHYLPEWIKPHLSERRKLKNIIDARLEGKYPRKSAVQIARLALHCLQNEPYNRPSMQEIVETLETIVSANDRPLHFSHQVVNHHGQQPLQNRSPLHPLQEATQSHPLLPTT